MVAVATVAVTAVGRVAVGRVAVGRVAVGRVADCSMVSDALSRLSRQFHDMFAKMLADSDTLAIVVIHRIHRVLGEKRSR
jgi:hypothetical protein